ncbi:MAG: TonB-dependent receptor, partial [Methylophilaceae bacterium]
GERVSEFRTVVGGYTLVNLTITSLAIAPNLQVSASIRNLFDRNYAHIASSAAMPIAAIPQNGRNFWLQMTYDFK